jgi:hypothetical protein
MVRENHLTLGTARRFLPRSALFLDFFGPGLVGHGPSLPVGLSGRPPLDTLCDVQRVTRERWWERRPGRVGMVVLAALFVALGTFFGVEEWGRSTLEAFGVAVLVLVLIVVMLRFGRP